MSTKSEKAKSGGTLYKGFLLMLSASFCACIGQVLWKFSAEHGLLLALLGLVIYGLGALLMIAAYRYGSVMVLQPVMAVNYVLSLLFGAIFFHETITAVKILGIIIISCGVYFIGMSEKDE